MWSTTEIVHFPSTHPTCPSTCWPIRQTQSNPDFSACERGPAALRGSCEAASEWRTVSFLTVFSDWCWTHQKDSGRLRLSCRSQLLGCTKKKITTGLFFFFLQPPQVPVFMLELSVWHDYSDEWPILCSVAWTDLTKKRTFLWIMWSGYRVVDLIFNETYFTEHWPSGPWATSVYFEKKKNNRRTFQRYLVVV